MTTKKAGLPRIQLEGPRQARAHRAAIMAQDQLLALAEVVLTTLGSSLKADEITEITIRPNNMKTIFVGPNGCEGVYEDPPGICRACEDGG